MEIFIELNKRFGTGYQIRMIHGALDKTYDKEPLTLYEAGAYVKTLLDKTNKVLGTNYEANHVLRSTIEGLEANAKRDLASARMFQDIKSGSYEYSIPEQQDFKKIVEDGEEQYLLTGRGTVLTTYFCWMDDKNERARAALTRYCQYIAAHGFKGGAMKALAELDRLDRDGAVEWIKRTYARHVSDDVALIQYVLRANE